jgi:hypothetical protein
MLQQAWYPDCLEGSHIAVWVEKEEMERERERQRERQRERVGCKGQSEDSTSKGVGHSALR